MGEMAIDASTYAYVAAQDAQRAVEASERGRKSEVARIEKLEDRVKTLESSLTRLIDVLAAQ